MTLQGRIALVTERSSGIGSAISAALREAGATVIGTDVAPRPDEGARTQALIAIARRPRSACRNRSAA